MFFNFSFDHKFRFVNYSDQKQVRSKTVQKLVTEKQSTSNDHIFQNTEAMRVNLV